MKKIVLVIFIMSLFIKYNFAQQKEAGLNIGYGKSAINQRIGQSNYFQIGVNFYVQPKKTPFLLKAELNYDSRGNQDISFNYLKLPLGIDFVFGNELKFNIGGGFYGSYLFHYKGTENVSGYKDSKKLLQIGWMADIGFSYERSKMVTVFLTFQVNHDITEMYTQPDPCGPGYKIPGTDGFLKLGFKYNLQKENNE